MNIKQLILLPATLLLALIMYGCNDFLCRMGDYVDKEKSEFYRYGRRDKNKVFYFRNIAWGDTPQEIIGADKETFTVIAEKWAKDKNSIYYRNARIENTAIDPASFTVASSMIDHIDKSVYKDKNHVYHLYPVENDYPNYGLKIIENADPATFENLGHGWAKDKDHVFRDNGVCNADAATFKIINYLFSCDRYHLFMNDFGISVIEKVNSAELELLNPYHIRTNSRVWYFRGRPNIPVSFPINENSKIETFDSNIGMLKIGDKLYINGHPYRDRDDINVADFSYVGGNSYFSDGKRIYYCAWNGDQVFPVSADVSTFSTIENFGKDSRHVYFRDLVIEDADPATFVYDKDKRRAYDSKNEYIYDSHQSRYIKR